jgi:hypothetical protein
MGAVSDTRHVFASRHTFYAYWHHFRGDLNHLGWWKRLNLVTGLLVGMPSRESGSEAEVERV